MIRRAFIFETQLAAKFLERTGVDLSQLSTAAVPDPLKRTLPILAEMEKQVVAVKSRGSSISPASASRASFLRRLRPRQRTAFAGIPAPISARL